MPIVYRKDTARGRIAVWHITETAGQLGRLATPGDEASCTGMGSPRRMRERLAWRALLRELVPQAGEVSYDAAGAPVIGEGWIGVSHCRDYAAVVFSHAGLCAVDIERWERDLGPVVPRFISLREREQAAAADPRFAAVVWCAKETLYKLSGLQGMDFIRDLRVEGIDFSGFPSRCRGYVRDARAVDLEVDSIEELCMVFTSIE